MKQILTASAIVAALALAGCGGESRFPEATGEGSVRAINAIPTSPSIAFLIEERAIASVNYKAASATTTYDDLDYTFNFEVLLAGAGSLSRVASQALTVVKDTDYTFVITGDLSEPTITIWESPIPEFGADATDFEIRLAHLAADFGAVDVYLAAPGIAPVLGEQFGTLTVGEFLPAARREAGDYVITVTAAGEPGTILFESEAIAPEATTSLMFVTFDADANELAPISVQGFNVTSGAQIPLSDVNSPTTVRFFHTNLDIGPTDIYVDDPLTTPLVEDHAFGDITADLSMPSDVIPLTYTAANNIGSVLLSGERSLATASRNQLYLVQTADGTDVIVSHVPDRRSVETQAKISIMNAAAIGTSIDIYVRPAGETIDEANPLLAAVPPALDPIRFTLAEGSYDIYVTPTGEKTVLAGPVTMDLVFGDVVEIIVYENVDPSVVDVVFVPAP